MRGWDGCGGSSPSGVSQCIPVPPTALPPRNPLHGVSSCSNTGVCVPLVRRLHHHQQRQQHSHQEMQSLLRGLCRLLQLPHQYWGHGGQWGSTGKGWGGVSREGIRGRGSGWEGMGLGGGDWGGVGTGRALEGGTGQVMGVGQGYMGTRRVVLGAHRYWEWALRGRMGAYRYWEGVLGGVQILGGSTGWVQGSGVLGGNTMGVPEGCQGAGGGGVSGLQGAPGGAGLEGEAAPWGCQGGSDAHEKGFGQFITQRFEEHTKGTLTPKRAENRPDPATS